MLELSAPAGSPEAVRAAVHSGADAVWLGFYDCNSRRNCGNLNENQMAAAAEYCRIRGVKTYVTLDTLLSDSSLELNLSLAEKAVNLGADALIIGDMGLMKVLRQIYPDLELHAGSRMGIHSLSGVIHAASLGATRAILAKELSADKIREICRRSPIEIGVYCHGPMCVSYAGLCYMSAFTSRKSCNFDYCSNPCKSSYGFGARADSFPLFLMELSLGGHLQELESFGVKSVVIEAGSRHPEYSAVVTDIFARSIKNKRKPGERDMSILYEAFNSPGFTDGYYTGSTGADMLGIPKKPQKKASSILSSVRADYMGQEAQRVPVFFYGLLQRGMPARLAAQDDKGNTAKVKGPVPDTTGSKELTSVILQTQLYKTGNTPYYCTGVKSIVDKGLYMDISEINKLRNECLQELTLLRRNAAPRKKQEFHPGLRYINREEPPDITISVLKADQLSNELAGLKPAVIYVPVDEIIKFPYKITPFWENGKTVICASLPPVIQDGEEDEILKKLHSLREIHIEDVLVNNPGHIQAVKALGLRIRGDYGLNVTNSQTLKVLKEDGLASATLSFELKLSEIRDLSKCMDTELVVYGRIPLLITENCIIKSSTGVCNCETGAQLRDKHGAVYPVLKAEGCRSIVYSPKKIYLADRQRHYKHIGLWGARLMFTTENEKECVQITERYLNMSGHEPVSRTRGLYY